MTIGIVGFGSFGKLAGKILSQYFPVQVYDPYVSEKDLSFLSGCRLVSLKEVCRCHIIIIAVPIQVFEQTIIDMLPHVKRDAIIIDVCSVKIIPAQIMKKYLPSSLTIIGTHPLFGPQSASDSLHGLKTVITPIQGNADKVITFIKNSLNLEVILTTPEDHDKEMAITQALLHWMAKGMTHMEPYDDRMATKSFMQMKSAFDMVKYDSQDVYNTIEKYNPYAQNIRKKYLDILTQLHLE